jgi:hypothetical protein
MRYCDDRKIVGDISKKAELMTLATQEDWLRYITEGMPMPLPKELVVKEESKMSSTYDIVVVVNQGQNVGTHIYEKQSSGAVRALVKAMDNDQVFGLLDANMSMVLFKPNEVAKLQFNLRESWVR